MIIIIYNIVIIIITTCKLTRYGFTRKGYILIVLEQIP